MAEKKKARKLTPKQQRFVDEYLVDLNATQAAIRAGYSPKSAGSIAGEYIRKPAIQAELQKRQQRLQAKLEISQEKVIGELAAVAFATGADYAKVVGGHVSIADTDTLTDDKKKAIARIKENQFGVEVKLYDKIRALELLGKYLGLFDNIAAQQMQLKREEFEYRKEKDAGAFQEYEDLDGIEQDIYGDDEED